MLPITKQLSSLHSLEVVKFTIEDMIEENDVVVVRWRSKSRQIGKFLGIEATNKIMEFTGVAIDHFEDGKIIKAATYTDIHTPFSKKWILIHFNGSREQVAGSRGCTKFYCLTKGI